MPKFAKLVNDAKQTPKPGLFPAAPYILLLRTDIAIILKTVNRAPRTFRESPQVNGRAGI